MVHIEAMSTNVTPAPPNRTPFLPTTNSTFIVDRVLHGFVRASSPVHAGTFPPVAPAATATTKEEEEGEDAREGGEGDGEADGRKEKKKKRMTRNQKFRARREAEAQEKVRGEKGGDVNLEI